MNYSIDELFEMLSWNSTEKVQLKGIAEAKKIKHLSVFMRPIESKSVWENCAKIIASKDDSELVRYLPELFQWLQDMNWPGAEIIYSKLKRLPPEEISLAYSLSVNNAKLLNDTVWLQVLETFRLDA